MDQYHFDSTSPDPSPSEFVPHHSFHKDNQPGHQRRRPITIPLSEPDQSGASYVRQPEKSQRRRPITCPLPVLDQPESEPVQQAVYFYKPLHALDRPGAEHLLQAEKLAQSPHKSEPTRRSRTKLKVISLVGVVLLIAVGISLYMQQHGSSRLDTPKMALNQFCDGFNKLDAHEVTDTYSKSLRAQNSESSTQSDFDKIKSQEENNHITFSCAVKDIYQHGSEAQGTVLITLTVGAQKQTKTGSMDLVQEDGQWRVNRLKDLA